MSILFIIIGIIINNINYIEINNNVYNYCIVQNIEGSLFILLGICLLYIELNHLFKRRKNNARFNRN